MGYAHYWSRIETPSGPLPPEPDGAYGRLALDTMRIFDAAGGLGIRLAGGNGWRDSAPLVDEGGIWLNGARPDDAEPFAWPSVPLSPWWSSMPGHRWWDACATDRQPYDLIVCAILIRARAHYGESVRITSDGRWHGSDGDGRPWPEWMPARQLVIELFGADADICPFLT